MNLRKIGILILGITGIFLSCNNDDNGIVLPGPVVRDRGVQQVEDNNSIVEYLNSHYYNASDFVGVVTPKIKDLVISTEPEGNAKLMDSVEKRTINFAETEYTFYFLRLNTGNGDKSPNFSDRIIYTYEGSLLLNNNTIFDSTVTPVQSNLIGNGSTEGGLIPGFRKVMPLFKTAESVVDNGDGTESYVNHGTGVMFLPSGLAYFNNSPSLEIPPYAPLIFKFELYQSTDNDYDNDGVPTHLEDIDGDGEFSIDPDDPEKEGDDDTDNDGIPDYVDADDDGDGILTIDEDTNEDGDPTNDIGPNSIPKYLDPES